MLRRRGQLRNRRGVSSAGRHKAWRSGAPGNGPRDAWANSRDPGPATVRLHADVAQAVRTPDPHRTPGDDPTSFSKRSSACSHCGQQSADRLPIGLNRETRQIVVCTRRQMSTPDSASRSRLDWNSVPAQDFDRLSRACDTCRPSIRSTIPSLTRFAPSAGDLDPRGGQSSCRRMYDRYTRPGAWLAVYGRPVRCAGSSSSERPLGGGTQPPARCARRPIGKRFGTTGLG
jgi:hypothetical protein